MKKFKLTKRILILLFFIFFIFLAILTLNRFLKDDRIEKEGSIFPGKDAKIYLENFDEKNITKAKEILNFIKIEKNNFIHDFLKNNKQKVFISSLKNEIKLKKVGNEYKYTSSLEINDLDKHYTKDFVERLSPYLQLKKIDDLELTLEIPLPIAEVLPPVGFYYGNDSVGVIPKIIVND